MMDGSANICVTGLLELLVDIEPIPPLPISVATKTAKFSLDSCCMKKGHLPLTLDDGSVYYQPCYYCKNASETIISPDAILQASNILVHWHQEGHRHGGPGKIRFSSDSGLYAITLSLEKRDGLYYCPTDVFTVAKDPTRPGVPTINRIVTPSVRVVAPPIASDYHLVGSIDRIKVPWPPMPPPNPAKHVPDMCTQLPLYLGHMASSITPRSFPARAATASALTPNMPQHPKAIDIMVDFNISRNDMAMIYRSPDSYYHAFEQPLDLRKFNIATHATAGLSLLESGGRLHLVTMSPSTITAKIKGWRTRMKGTWLIKIGSVNVSTITDAKLAFQALHDSGSTSTTLLFAHPEVWPNLSHDGLPIMSSAPFSQATHDQLNNRWEFTTVADHLCSCRPTL